MVILNLDFYLIMRLKEYKMKKTKRQNKGFQLLKKRQAEANARRKVNEKWECVESLRCYQKAAVREGCNNITATIEEECFDGILLHLSSRSESKSYNSQKRILRRIVEKRQAQSIHRTIGRTTDRFSTHMKVRSISSSVSELRRSQFCT